MIAILTFPLLLFVPAKAQRLRVPMGAELMYSREQAGLIGPVRTVVTVEKRDEGGFVRTFGTSAETYNLQGAAIEKISHSADIEIHSGKLVRLDYTDIYVYDSAGKLSQMVTYDPDGSFRQKLVFTYDGSGRLSEEKAYSREGNLFSKSVYAYDSEKRTSTMMLSIYIENRVIPSKSIFTYNAKGQWVKRLVYDSTGAVTDNTAFENDGRGNLIKETRYDKKGEPSYACNYSYKFDSRGNWIEKQDSCTRVVTFRVVTYYGDK
jgi:hypothetical protein